MNKFIKPILRQMLASRLPNANGNKTEREFIPHQFVNFKNQQEFNE